MSENALVHQRVNDAHLLSLSPFFSRSKQSGCSVSYHIITSSYSISVSCCPMLWRRRLINKREYSYPTNGTRRGSVPDRKQIKRCEKKEKKRREGKKMRECRRGNRGATRRDKSDDPTRRRAWHYPRFPRSFPAYCFPLRIRLRVVPFSPPASASQRRFMHLYEPDRERIREWRRRVRRVKRQERKRRWRRRRRRKRISSLDNRRRRVIAFALEPAIYDRSRQRTGAAVPRGRFPAWLMQEGVMEIIYSVHSSRCWASGCSRC